MLEAETQSSIEKAILRLCDGSAAVAVLLCELVASHDRQTVLMRRAGIRDEGELYEAYWRLQDRGQVQG